VQGVGVTRWTEADLAQVVARSGRPVMSVGAVTKAHKYHAKGTDVDGIHFPTKLEARCYEEQKFRRDVTREVAFFLRQTPFHLEGGVVYRCDFFCVLAAGGIEVIDAKGYDTRESINKRKQVKARYGVEVKLWRGGK
jgi:hypothetical protein